MPFSYANPTSGPSAGGIGWFNFDTFTTINPGQTISGLTGILNDGTTVTFDLTATNVSGSPRSFDTSTVPVHPSSAFGTAGYTGISGNVALNASLDAISGVNQLILSNIVVKDNLGNPVLNYTAIVADAEITGAFEDWIWNTNGSPWTQLAQLGVGTTPILTGLGTNTATLTGNNSSPTAVSFVLTTQNPTQLQLSTVLQPSSIGSGREAVSIGFATTHVRLQKNLATRINPADQFQLDVAGIPSGTATTIGANVGIQTQVVDIFAIPGNTYTINESMASGSVSPLSAYTQMVSVANSTPSGSLPPTGNLPITFTPALGDDVTYSILNIAPEEFTKTVDKAYANLGDILTYTVSVANPNDFAISNVVVNDTTPVGVTFVGGSLVVIGSSYTGNDPNSGITLTSIPANTTVTLIWQVQVNSLPPIFNPITNVATITVPGGTSGSTNAVTTQVNTAYITVNKVADKTFVNASDIITYTLILNNAGNMAANNVVLTDSVPSGTTFVPGSVTGATGIPPTLMVASIPAGGSSNVTFQVQVGNIIPSPNPIPNFATVSYTYTVDPAVPNGATGTSYSNTISTQVNTAKLIMKKAVDKSLAYLNDIITYQISVTNTGNSLANNVVITDPIPIGTVLVPGSITVNVPYTALPDNVIALTNPVMPDEIISISFKVLVTVIPIPNPIVNTANATYTYTVDPSIPNGVGATAQTNAVTTTIFRNNFGQQISDLIESVALEQAAIAAIANAEGAKIQRMVAITDITPAQLLCLNKSVSDMMDSLTILETVLKQKLLIVDCQMNGETC